MTINPEWICKYKCAAWKVPDFTPAYLEPANSSHELGEHHFQPECAQLHLDEARPEKNETSTRKKCNIL